MWGKHGSFPHKTLWIAIVFPHMNFFFFMIFFKIIFVDFVEENIVSFLTKHYELLQYFPTLFFLFNFIFLTLQLQVRLNNVGKAFLTKHAKS